MEPGKGVLDELRRDAGRSEGLDWTVAVDGAVVRAHQHPAGARYRLPVDVDRKVVAPLELDTGGSVE